MARQTRRRNLPVARYRICRPAFSPEYQHAVRSGGRVHDVRFKGGEFETANPELIANLDSQSAEPNAFFCRVE